MSQEWFTAKALAGLPGMPDTHSAVVRRAKRDGWEDRRCSGRGGGREYALASLPAETQAAALRASNQAAATTAPATRPTVKKAAHGPVDREALWESYDSKPQSLKDEAAKRLSILLELDQLVANGVTKSQAVNEVCKGHDVGRNTLYNWKKLVDGVRRDDWLAALMPSYACKGRRTAAYSEEAWDFFKALYLTPEKRNVSTCHEWTKQAAKEHGWNWPPLRTVNRWVDDIPRTVKVLQREGEAAMLQLYPTQQRTVRDLHACYWINGDGYQHNVFVRFPDGSIGRPKTWFWQDIYSRRVLAWRTDRTENNDMIRLALGDVLERYGIPEHVTIDNTRAAANKWLTAGVRTRYRFKVKEDDPVGLLPALGIQIHWTTVLNGKGHGQAKPVERAFGVGGMGEYVDKHPKFAGAYTGPNVNAKPENYGETAVKWETFIEVLEQAITHWNAMDKRRTEMCAGVKSFDAVFRESYERNAHQIRKPTDTQRRLWLMAAEAVKVKAGGTVELDVGKSQHGKNRYGCDELIEYQRRKVVVRFDPDQLHESVYLYQLDGRYIGEAACIHAAGFGDTTRGREWGRLKEERRRSVKKAAEAEVRMTATEAAGMMPDPEPEAPLQTNVVRMAPAEKRVAGSDVVPDEEESPADKHRFNDTIIARMEQWRDDQI